MKLKLVLSTTIGLLFITGCSKSEHNADAKTVLPKHAIQSAALGSIEQCKSYTGLPTDWLKIQPQAWYSFQMGILILVLKSLSR